VGPELRPPHPQSGGDGGRGYVRGEKLNFQLAAFLGNNGGGGAGRSCDWRGAQVGQNGGILERSRQVLSWTTNTTGGDSL
jgi:hypothetical protein